MTRDRKADPQFGDVFSYDGNDEVTLFLRSEADGGWVGLDIRTNGTAHVSNGLKDVSDPEWFVEPPVLPEITGWTHSSPVKAVHHINGNPSDNRPENLMVVSPATWVDP